MTAYSQWLDGGTNITSLQRRASYIHQRATSFCVMVLAIEVKPMILESLATLVPQYMKAGTEFSLQIFTAH